MLVIAIVVVICMLILGNFIIGMLDIVSPKKFDENEYFDKLKKIKSTKDLPSLTCRPMIMKSKLDVETKTSYVDPQQPELNVDLTKTGEDIKDLYDPVMFTCKPDIKRDNYSQSSKPHIIKTDNGKIIQDVGGQLIAFEKDFEGISGGNRSYGNITKCGPSRDIKELELDGYH